MASQPKDLPALRKEFKARRQAGFNVQFLEQSEVEDLFSFSAPGNAIFSFRDPNGRGLCPLNKGRLSWDVGTRIVSP